MSILTCARLSTDENDLPFVKEEFVKWRERMSDHDNGDLAVLRYRQTPNVVLYGNEYHRSVVMVKHLEELFLYSKKYLTFLAKPFTLTALSPDMVTDISRDYCELRKEIVKTFVTIRENLEEVRAITMEGERGPDSARNIISTLKIEMYNFRLAMKNAANLPRFVKLIFNARLPNQSLTPSFQYFHLFLEMLWLHMTTLVEVYLLEKELLPPVIQLDKEEVCFEYVDVNAIQYTTNLDDELEWIVYNLVVLCSKCFDKVGPNGIFSCSCVKELWVATLLTVETLHSRELCSDIWKYFNKIINEYVLKSKPMSRREGCGTLMFQMKQIPSSNPWEFCMCLLVNIVKLQKFGLDGVHNESRSIQCSPNYTLLEDIVEKFLQDDASSDEACLRLQMGHIVELLAVYWETRNEIIILLWEFFHKRLNCEFRVAGRDDPSYNISHGTPADIIIYLKSRLSLNQYTRDYPVESSFTTFMCLMGAHLKKCQERNDKSSSIQLKGRILLKFTKGKLMGLSEVGLEHFSTIFLTLAITIDLHDVCTRLQNFLSMLPFSEMDMAKKKVILKTHICIMCLYVESDAHLQTVYTTFSFAATKYSSLKNADSHTIMNIVMRGLYNITEASKNLDCGEYLLIDRWMQTYLTACATSKLGEVSFMISCLLSKLNDIADYTPFPSDNFVLLVHRLYEHVLSSIRTLFANGTECTWLSTMAFHFTKFTFNHVEMTARYTTFEDTFNFFLNCNMAKEKTMIEYLVKIFQNDSINEALKTKYKDCQKLLIQCWVRCQLLCPDHGYNEEKSSLLLANFPEFAEIGVTISPNHGNQNNLCAFFKTFGHKWSNASTAEEKKRLTKCLNEYLGPIDKYVVAALRSPRSMANTEMIILPLTTLLLTCAPMIYSKTAPSLMNEIVRNILLPPQLLSKGELSRHVKQALCENFYALMLSLYQLGPGGDYYIQKVSKDMVLQYLPLFTTETIITQSGTHKVLYKLIPPTTSGNSEFDKYLFEKIARMFLINRGNMANQHASRVMAVLHDVIINTTDVLILRALIKGAFLSVCEQIMFVMPDSTPVTSAKVVMKALFENPFYLNPTKDKNVQVDVRESLEALARKNLALSSKEYFQLIIDNMESLYPVMDSLLAFLQNEVNVTEVKRGTGHDTYLRGGLQRVVNAHLDNIF